MARGVIYSVDGDGLRRMLPSAPPNEDFMQQLVARYPELISDGDGELLLIAREPSIGDGEAMGRWALDHLFVTKSAVPVLVELKRATDTRLRREVVGQLIDYAANASAHWEPGTIASSFARTVGADKANALLTAFIGDSDFENFWEQVDSNLVAGRIKLVFVADVIPRELATVVEFLNEQMKADVRAVELRWYAEEASGATTLSPRVIGETSRSVAKNKRDKKSFTVSQWVAERIESLGPEMIKGVNCACLIAERQGGEVFVPNTGGSIIASWQTDDGKLTYPFGIYPSGMVVLRLGYLKYRKKFASNAARQELYNDLADIVGPLHTNSLAGEPGFSATKLLDDDIARSYEQFLKCVINEAVIGE